MESKWLTSPLGSVVTFQRGFDLPSQKRKPGAVPIVSSSGISGYHSEVGVKGPGVVTGRYGTIGQVFLIEEDYWPLNTTLWVKDFHGNDPQFIAYLLRTIDFHSCSDKSSVPGVNRNDLHQLEVSTPPLPEQKRIAGILGALDDKIELNRKMNETLEQMAKALFKSWFVDFDPVYAKAAGRHPAGMDKATADLFPDSFVDSELGKIPKGWRPTTIGNCCERIFSGGTPNTSNRSFWDGDIPWLSSGETRESFITQTEKFITKAGVENSSTRHARKGCTAIASAGQGHTRGQTSMLTGDFYINQSVVALESKKGASTDLFNYFTMERRYEELRQLSDSNSSRGSLTTKLVAQMSVVLPPDPLLSAFDKFAIPLVELIVKNASQTRSICAIRDSLLPQLLAGSNNSQHLNIT